GAGRMRIVRQLLAESVLLGLVGGGLGLVVAQWGTPAALSLLPAALPRAAEIGVDARVLAFTLVVSVAAGVLFGLAPALPASRPDLAGSLKEGGRGVTGSGRRVQDIFVVAELAMVLVLLVGSGLLFRTLTRIWRTSPGFEPSGVLTLGLSLPPAMSEASPDAMRAAWREVNARVEAMPGVEAVAASWAAVPMLAEDDLTFWPDDRPRPSDLSQMRWALHYVVGAQY